MVPNVLYCLARRCTRLVFSRAHSSGSMGKLCLFENSDFTPDSIECFLRKKFGGVFPFLFLFIISHWNLHFVANEMFYPFICFLEGF